MKKIRIAIVTNIPAPYRFDLFNELSHEESLILKVFFCYITEPGRNWQFENYDFPYKFITYSNAKNKIYYFPWLFVKLLFYLYNFKPNVIISTGASIESVISWLYSFIFDVPVVVWWGGTPETEKKIGLWRSFFRKIFFKIVNGFISYGSFAKKYLKSLGIDDKKIYVAGNLTFDAKKFNEKVNKIRVNLSKKEKIYLLAVGQLIKRKNYNLLLEIFNQICENYKNIHLIIIGDGVLNKELKKFCEINGLSEKVTFTGYISPENIFYYYALSDIFIHPTLLDHWGQVVNEALCAALPIVVSNKDGIVYDFIVHKENGFVFNPDKKDELINSISILIENPHIRYNIAKKGLETALKHDVHFVKDVFLRCINNSINKKYKK